MRLLRLMMLMFSAVTVAGWDSHFDVGIANAGQSPQGLDTTRVKPVPTGRNFMGMAELVKLARIKSSDAVPEQYRQSLPIPVIEAGEVLVLFLYCPALALPKQPVKLNPPHFVLRLSATTGALKELKAVTPMELHHPQRPSDLLGVYAMPDGMTYEGFIAKQDELYEKYDFLLVQFVEKGSAQDPMVKKSVIEFKELFTRISEPPLIPYYRAAGQEFFSWLDQASR